MVSVLTSAKRVPTHLQEFRHAWNAGRLERQLRTPAGRAAYWNEQLPAKCAANSMLALLESTLHLEGDVVECGVYRGKSLMQIARVLTDRAPEKKLLGLDSFGGFPDDHALPCDVGSGRTLGRVAAKFRFVADAPVRLRRRFAMFGVNAELVPGYFSNTLPLLAEQTFCFVHLDVDLYASYLECLEALYDRLTPGGVVVFDECDEEAWPGATRAIREFFGPRAEEVSLCLEREKPAYYVRKPLA